MSKVKYIRVSTEEQNIERQVKNAKDFSKVYIDKVSGAISFSDRKEARKLLRDIDAGLVTEVHVSSIDRLGRNILDILTVIEHLTEKSVTLFVENIGMYSIIDNNHFSQICCALKNHYHDISVTKVVAVESRGFFFGSALAAFLNVGFVPLRKPGKLPSSVFSASYQKEYATDILEIHTDALTSSDVVVLHDDVLATGGTINASLELLSNFNIKSIYLDFLLEIESLDGRSNITRPYTAVHSFLKVP